VILPINGFSVPFHINTIKNVGKTEEGEWTYLRVNFQTPGQLAGKKGGHSMSPQRLSDAGLISYVY
jgi:nucleosome binding factor SPN SPT16 subunit